MSSQMDYEINKELGECYLFMGDFDKAEEYYRKAAENNTESAAPYMGLATVAVQRSELDKALVLYKKAAAVEALPKVSSMLDKLAKRNIIHKNKAARNKSALVRKLNAAQ